MKPHTEDGPVPVTLEYRIDPPLQARDFTFALQPVLWNNGCATAGYV
jgi:hypothetical protein